MAVILLISNKRNKSSILKFQENKLIEDCNLSLKLKDKTSQYNFFKKVFKKYLPQKQKNALTFVKDNKKYFLFIFLEEDFLNRSSYYNIVKDFLNKCDKLLIICNNVKDSELSLRTTLNSTEIIVFDKFSTYIKLLKPNNVFPEIMDSKIEKFKFKDVINIIFRKENFKRYLLSGILILFVSFIIPFKLYYRIIASILILFSLICLIKKEELSISDF